MKQNLIVFYSPIDNSFTKQIANRLNFVFQNKNEKVMYRDLKKLNFNPILSEDEILMSKNSQYAKDVLIEQEFIKNSSDIYLIFPLYQLAMPSVMKGYIDRVLTQGFSYAYDENYNVIPYMNGKNISILSVMGATFDYAKSNGNIDAMNHIIKQIFSFRGFNIDTILYFGSDNRQGQLIELEDRLKTKG